MGFRIKLGPFLSLGRSGPRFHLNTKHLSGSAGAGGGRLYGRLGPLYGNWSTKSRKKS